MKNKWRTRGSVMLLLLFLSLSGVFILEDQATAKALPQHKNIVLTIFENESNFFQRGLDIGSAEATVKRILLDEGYPVVNEAQLRKIKESKAAWLAFQGDADALLRLGSKYNIKIFVTGKLSRHVPRKNPMGLYTGTAAISVQAYSSSNGKYLFSDTAEGKGLGYTVDEASENALQEAATIMGQKLTGLDGGAVQSGSVSQSVPSLSGVVQLHVANVNDFARANEILSVCKDLSGTVGAKISQYGGGAITITVEYRGTGQQFAKLLSTKGLPIGIRAVNGNNVEAAAR